MAVPTIALYASPPSTVCTTPYPCSISSHTSYDFDINARSSSSATASPSQKQIIGGLSCLFSSPSVVKHASSSGYSGAADDLRHEKVEDLSRSFCYSPYPSLNSYPKRDPSPVSVFQAPVSCSSSPPRRFAGDLNKSGRVGSTNRLFNGFVRHALGSCVDYDSPSFEVHDSSPEVDELTFNMEDHFLESNYSKDLLLNAQLKHKIFRDDVVIKAFYEAEKAHRGQV